MDLLKFCWHFCDLDFVHSNFKVIQYLRLTIAFKLVLSQSSQILLPLCSPAILSLAVSCFNLVASRRTLLSSDNSCYFVAREAEGSTDGDIQKWRSEGFGLCGIRR